MTPLKRPFFYFILFLTLCSLNNSFAQEFVQIIPISNDVLTINEISFKNKLSKSGWRSNYFYENGNLKRQINFYKNELRMDENYNYIEGNNSLKVKQNNTNRKDLSMTITYFDSLKRVTKSELYFTKDTINPEVLSDSFIYSPNGKLISYKRTFIKTKQADCWEFKYEKERLKELLLFIDCQRLTKKTTLSYNKQGNLTDEVVDHQDSNAVIMGARSEGGVQRFHYVFDKRGNWTKRYFVTSSGRKILEAIRKINYTDD